MWTWDLRSSKFTVTLIWRNFLGLVPRQFSNSSSALRLRPWLLWSNTFPWTLGVPFECSGQSSVMLFLGSRGMSPIHFLYHLDGVPYAALTSSLISQSFPLEMMFDETRYWWRTSAFLVNDFVTYIVSFRQLTIQQFPIVSYRVRASHCLD